MLPVTHTTRKIHLLHLRGAHLRWYLLNRTGTSIKHPTPLNEVLIVRTEQCPET